MSIKPIGYVPTGTPEEIKEAYEFTRKGFDYMCGKEYPLVHPEYPKCVAPNIWEIKSGFFVYADETGNFSDNIYTCIEDAQTALNAYGDWLCKEPEGVIYE